jgi:photosystem II stability/assembly factor-like uncharacterized protein
MLSPRRVLLAVLLSLALPASASAAVTVGQSGWSWGNPTPQGNAVRAIEFGGGKGYAVGDSGTALRTDDNGATWSGLATGTAAHLERVQVIDADSIIVLGGDGCVIRRSDDAGKSFKRLFAVSEIGCPDPVQSLFFVSETTGYLLLRDGSVLLTKDKGETFAKQTAIPGTPAATGGGQLRTSDLAFTAPGTGIVFANPQAGGNAQAFATTDEGVSWKPVADLPAGNVRRVRFLDATTGFAVGSTTLLRTMDGGATWQARNAGAGANLTSLSCADASTCLLTTLEGDRLLRTTDGGDTVTPVTAATKAIYAAGFASTARVVAAGLDGATVVSDDAGQNWSAIGGDIGGTYSSLVLGPAGTVYAPGNAGRLGRSTDGGATWGTLAVATSSDIVGVSFATAQVGYALDARGGLFKTANGGASWQTLDPGTTTPARAVAALGSGDTVLLVGPKGIRRNAADGRFAAVGGRTANRAALDHLDVEGKVVVAWASGANVVLLSTDSGAKWKKVKLPGKKTRVLSLDFTDAGHGYLVDTQNRVWTTANGGKRWTERLGVGTDPFEVSAGTATSAFLTLGSYAAEQGAGYALHTTDGGKTWRPQRISTATLPGSLVARGANEAYALLGERKFFFTKTGGDAGEPSTLSLAGTKKLSKKQLKKKKGKVAITGTLKGAQGGERIVVSRRDAKGVGWKHQVVTAGANGGSFTTSWKIKGSSVFVAQWAGDSGRAAVGSSVFSVRVK